MPVTTVKEELQNAWTTYIAPNYPDIATINGAINLTTMQVEASDDIIAYFLAATLVLLRSPRTYGYTLPEGSADRKLLYQELSSEIGAAIANLTAIQGFIDTHITELP